jgi:hypothetical protein
VLPVIVGASVLAVLLVGDAARGYGGEQNAFFGSFTASSVSKMSWS